jgi:hypothetical protein
MNRIIVTIVFLIAFSFGEKAMAQKWIQLESASIVAGHPLAIYDGAQGTYLRNNIQFSIKEKFLLEAGYGVLNSYDETADQRGIAAWHMSTFSIAAYLQPVNSKFIKFNLGAGVMRMQYHSYFADAFGNKYSPQKDIILQHVINTYDWKNASEFSGNLLVRCYKNLYGGAQFSYVKIMGKIEPFMPDGFFNLGIQAKYYFNLK